MWRMSRFLFWQNIGASRWTVCYQRGLRRLVYKHFIAPNCFTRIVVFYCAYISTNLWFLLSVALDSWRTVQNISERFQSIANFPDVIKKHWMVVAGLVRTDGGVGLSSFNTDQSLDEFRGARSSKTRTLLWPSSFTPASDSERTWYLRIKSKICFSQQNTNSKENLLKPKDQQGWR